MVTPLLTAGLIDSGMEADESIEFLNILDEDLIKDVYRRFKMAGAQCVLTNTLKANREELKKHGLESALVDVNRAGMRIAREMGFEHIIAVLGCAPSEALVEQAHILLQDEPDALLLVLEDEGSNEPEILEALGELTSIPLIAPTGGTIVLCMGLSEAESLAWLRQTSPTETRPLMVCPRVSIKEALGKGQEQQALALAGDALVDFALQARALGAQFIGTAPGTAPVFTGALAATLGGLDVEQQAST